MRSETVSSITNRTINRQRSGIAARRRVRKRSKQAEAKLEQLQAEKATKQKKQAREAEAKLAS